MQVLEKLCNNLPLWAVVFLSHCSVNQLQHILVEMIDELPEVSVMCLWSKTLPANPFNLISLVNPFVVQHLVLGKNISVLGEEVLSLFINSPVHDIYECRSSLHVLKIDVPQDSGVDDDMIFDIVIRHVDAAIPDLSLCHCHPVVVHLLLGELVVLVEGLGEINQSNCDQIIKQSTGYESHKNYDDDAKTLFVGYLVVFRAQRNF